MQAASLPPSAGWLWVRQGYELFRRQPMPMFSWALNIGVLVLIASMLVPVGPALFVILMPAITVMTLEACRDIEAGKTVHPLLLWTLLRRPGMARRLFTMGAIYLLGIIVAGVLAFLPFMGTLAEAANQVELESSLLPLMDAMRRPFIIFAVLYLMLAALFWHAPVLVAWHGMGLRKALFFSGVACWRNKGAFVLYGLAWAVLVFAFEILTLLMGMVGLPGMMITLVQMPLSFVVAAILYCSFYPTYTTVFGAPPEPSPEVR